MGLKIREIEFREKFTEINFRQRMYQGENFLTVIINSEFYPSLVKEAMVSGSIEVKLDVKDISKIDDLVGKSYKGDVGSVTISVNNNGIWEHQSYDNFEMSFVKREGTDLLFRLVTDEAEVETTGVMVSLYTTSSSKEELSECFLLEDFYQVAVEKEIAGKKIVKYFLKG